MRLFVYLVIPIAVLLAICLSRYAQVLRYSGCLGFADIGISTAVQQYGDIRMFGYLG